MPEAPQDDGPSTSPAIPGSPRSVSPNSISLPKNRSTGSFSAYSKQAQSQGRIRFSLDGGRPGEYETMLKSPIIPEQEHGLGASGLRRIRQGPTRVATLPPSPEQSFSFPSRSSSMTMLSTRTRSNTPGPVPPSPGLTFSEDLSRFPTESLHSFSFTAQSEEYLQNRQSVIAKSIDFMREQSSWAAKNPAIINAQAKVSGDTEMQSMVELLSRAKFLDQGQGGLALGPVTGPALIDSQNPFEREFSPRAESPEAISDTVSPHAALSPSIVRHTPQGSRVGIQAPASPPAPVPHSGYDENSVARNDQSAEERRGMKRTYTDTSSLKLQTKLADALAQPYMQSAGGLDSTLLSPTIIPGLGKTTNMSLTATHGQRWSPAAQAIFTTEAKAPWTILAANDLACLVFGVTRAEIKKLGMLEVVQQDKRQWLEEKLASPGSEAAAKARAANNLAKAQKTSPTSPTSNLNIRGGITALLLSKPPSRHAASKKTQTDGDSNSSRHPAKGESHHTPKGSRGVLLCGDVVPIQKRNGATGSASLWVKEKKGGLIWVVEEIVQDIAFLTVDLSGKVLSSTGAVAAIWGRAHIDDKDLRKLVPRLPMTTASPKSVDFGSINKTQHFTATNMEGYSAPISIEANVSLGELRVSSFPHIAGILVLNSRTLEVTSSNSVFTAALFGYNNADGRHITELIPHFTKYVDILAEDDDVELVDGVVVPEQSFRRARALLALREGNADASAIFEHPSSISAKHRDGSQLQVDVQMRVVKSDASVPEVAVIEERDEDKYSEMSFGQSEVVFALWVTYSRHLHSVVRTGPSSPLISRPGTPPHQPSPGQSIALIDPDTPQPERNDLSPEHLLKQQIKEAAEEPISAKPDKAPVVEIKREKPATPAPPKKKTIDDFVILEDMGQGAYGQVKLARYKEPPGDKVVLKYVTKKRILVDTWTRDRKLGTVPLEIHVLDFLRRDGYKHPNIVEMIGFFEDSVNYYIEMVPHGLPGMDLFDYIEMRPSMEEDECRKIFLQVADAIYHLHVRAKVVHRDIKDENIILDSDNQVKLIDFGSAAYIKSGPFDVFVGTIDYAAPEVLQGENYGGKEQDVWALGILLYTLVYKENPFYSVDEILDRDLRIPWIMSEGSIDLIKLLLNRTVKERPSIEEVLAHPWCEEGRSSE